MDSVSFTAHKPTEVSLEQSEVTLGDGGQYIDLTGPVTSIENPSGNDKLTGKDRDFGWLGLYDKDIKGSIISFLFTSLSPFRFSLG